MEILKNEEQKIVIGWTGDTHYFRIAFEQVFAKVFPTSKIINIMNPSIQHAPLLNILMVGFVGDSHASLPVRPNCLRILACGEPNTIVGRLNGAHLILDCKTVPELRSPGIPFEYLPFFVISFGERFQNSLTDMIKKGPSSEERTKFCAFMYSQDHPHRTGFFDKLNARKRVDALGRVRHNTPDHQPDRHVYQVGKVTFNDLAVQSYRDYKFVLCIENTLLPGYVTEKMMSAMLAGCVPVYWGAPDITKWFNPKSFIHVRDFDSVESCINHILKVDQDPQLYHAYQQEPYFYNNEVPEIFQLPDVVKAVKEQWEIRKNSVKNNNPISVSTRPVIVKNHLVRGRRK